MLAGCSSSTLLSPRHRLRTESPAQFPACHFQLPTSMNTQRLDLPCSNFSRKDAASTRSQSIRPVGVAISVEKPIEAKKAASCSLKQHIRLPPLTTAAPAVAVAAAAGTATSAFVESRKGGELWERGGKKKNLKRFAEEEDESRVIRAKRKRSGEKVDEFGEDDCGGGDALSMAQLGGGGGGSFWFQPSFTTAPTVPFSITCSGEGEDRACFIPGEVVSPRLPVSSIPWVDSVVTEITDLGEKDGETTSHRPSPMPGKEASGGSSTSSESHQSLTLRLNEAATSEHKVGNGSSRNPYQEAREEEENQGEYRGFEFELVSLLTACVEAIGSKNIPAINHFIAKLGDLASPRGPTISRLAAYYTEAFALRVTRLWPHIFHITMPRELDRAVDDDNSGAALRLLNQVSPIPKFVHFTSNEILLRAFEGKDRVHIIDFDIKQGLQWPGLFQSLASRANPPSHVRITGIGDSKQELIETGERLSSFAEALNLPFEFHPVVDRLEDVRLWMLHVKEGECVAVNCIFQLHKTLYDASGGALRDFLGLVRSTNPAVLVMAEQGARSNFRSLEARVVNSLRYYAAVFDSVDSSLPMESPERVKIEEMFAREIRNIVACEGSDRVERHEVFETWRKLMEEQGGFRCFGITDRERLQGQMILRMYGEYEDFQVEEQAQGRDRAALTLSWRDQPLYTVSAWAPVDHAGSSSSFSQPS
ncbi:scarecrow-like protein 28 [Punica granatum]|uniref:Uncharacterized protein n=2 Tax=Punica granatum TaxID=22663 RepID=A0A218WGL6_PUNGR|nr:scarecrow-like protein 28 [Punica granatum]OWM71994.1 hypothetical protein CDL15_Pgr017877 [Punica granatum]PKI65308.1 hypothetical protein CRG98_014272 [Punica granatum]